MEYRKHQMTERTNIIKLVFVFAFKRRLYNYLYRLMYDYCKLLQAHPYLAKGRTSWPLLSCELHENAKGMCERHVHNSRTESTMKHLSLQTQSTSRQSPIWQLTILISHTPANQEQCTPHHVPAILEQIFGLKHLGPD